MSAYNESRIRAAVRELLLGIGEDPDREGLRDTPDRVARSFLELAAGYRQSPSEILSAQFAADGYDEMVVCRQIQFYSMCEHHLLPFHGTVAIAYIPGARVAGLSKLARLVHCYARRLQLQERMTAEIGAALEEHLKPHGYGVLVRGVHLCMCSRGVRSQGAEMVTSALGGLLKTDAKARHEFLTLANA